jgi:hypothetical protein
MAQHQIRFQLGLLDLWTLLFTTKRCPVCRRSLVRRTEKESTGPGWQRDGEGLSFEFWYGDRSDVTLLYACETCRVRYTLAQLRRGEGGEPFAEDQEPIP